MQGVVRRQSTQRAAQDRGVLAIRQGAVVGVDEGLDHVDDIGDEGAAEIGQEAHVRVRDQLVETQFAAVVDADDDRGEVIIPRQLVHGFVDAPLARVAGGVVEQVLPVEHVQHRIAPRALRVVRRQVHAQPAGVSELRHAQRRDEYAHGRAGGMRARGFVRGRGQAREQEGEGEYARQHGVLLIGRHLAG